jgi:hypothetical protein
VVVVSPGERPSHTGLLVLRGLRCLRLLRMVHVVRVRTPHLRSGRQMSCWSRTRHGC